MSAQAPCNGLKMSACRAGLWLLPVIAGLCGCARSPARSMARVWEDVPKISWSRVTETPEEKKSEDSQVAANRPSTRSEGDESSTSESTGGKLRMPSRSVERRRAKETDSRFVAQNPRNHGPHDPFMDDGPNEATSGREVVESQTVSARTRLRAALSDDSRRLQAAETIRQTSEQERLRVRIESLMARARSYLNDEELISAKRTAELARNLAETSNLEFAPDEERPVDLLAMIEGKLAAEAAEGVLAETVIGAASSEQTTEATAERGAKRRTVRHPFESAVPFDPYAPRVALARHHEADEPLFGTSLVVLESPSFEEEATKRDPVAYVRRSPRDRFEDRSTTLPESDGPGAVCEESPLLEEERGEPELPLPDLADAPPPPSESSAARSVELVEPVVTTASAVLDLDVAEEEEEVRSASVWPRWMPLSLLSLLVAGFCIWLWRRRSQTELASR